MGLSSELTFYAFTKFEKYIPEKSLHDAICEVHPVPNDLNQVKKKKDEFLKDLLKVKNKIQWYSGKKYRKRLSLWWVSLCGGSLIQGMVQVGECEEV